MISKTILAAAAFCTLMGSTAMALTPQEQAEFKKNCTADYTRLCAAFPPDSDEVKQCFQQKIKQVSARCQRTIASFKS
ncbi:hypothetical protein [uncultured Enterovirga sp.]|uniref:hypothetical protein n=1 Tax=uncultured Enterovirga sp. TaxID=2026352 RepID=UPI0035C95AE2